MLVALALAAFGVFALSRYSGKSPASMVIILLLLGMGYFIFTKVQGGVIGGLQKQVG